MKGEINTETVEEDGRSSTVTRKTSNDNLPCLTHPKETPAFKNVSTSSFLFTLVQPKRSPFPVEKKKKKSHWEVEAVEVGYGKHDRARVLTYVKQPKEK